MYGFGSRRGSSRRSSLHFRIRGNVVGAEQEMGTREYADDRRANAVVETVLLGVVIIGKTFLELARRERAPVRTSRERADDLGRARVLLVDCFGIASEHAITARRVEQRGDLKRPSDLEAPRSQHLHPS